MTNAADMCCHPPLSLAASTTFFNSGRVRCYGRGHRDLGASSVGRRSQVLIAFIRSLTGKLAWWFWFLDLHGQRNADGTS